MRILVAEGHPQAARAVVVRLRADGHAVDGERTVPRARAALMDVDYDCLVVGAHRPDEAVLALVAEARRDRAGRSVVVLAAADPEWRIAALAAGADVLLPRPVVLDELALHVRKLLVRRASRAPEPDGVVRLGRLSVHRERREVTVDGRRVGLTPTQYALLDHLVAHRDRVVTTAELLERGWDWTCAAKTNPLPVHMSRLRRTFQGVLRIDVTRGVGYRVAVEEPVHTS